MFFAPLGAGHPRFRAVRLRIGYSGCFAIAITPPLSYPDTHPREFPQPRGPMSGALRPVRGGQRPSLSTHRSGCLSMPISFECDQCRRPYQFADELAGKRGRCKQCGYMFTIPAEAGPTATDLYELEAGERTDRPPEDEPAGPVKGKKKGKKASGLFALSALPAWGLTVYRCVILTLLVVSLLVGGLAKLIIAMTGVFLAVGPFVASGFRYRYGIAFRDGPIAGVLYMVFVPYRIHYRLTHQELFRNLRSPTLTLRDFSLLFLGLLFLPVIILAAQDMDKRARNRPPAVDWTKFASKPADFGIPPVPTHKGRARPDRPGPPKGIMRGPFPTGPRPADTVTAEPKTREPAPPNRPPSPPSPGRRLRGRHRHNPREPTRWPAGIRLVDRGWAARSDPAVTRGARRCRSRPAGPAPSYGPDVTVTITVSGVPDFQATRRLNDAIAAILKSLGDNWSLQSNTGGGKATFTAAPVSDPKAFARPTRRASCGGIKAGCSRPAPPLATTPSRSCAGTWRLRVVKKPNEER